MGLICVVAVVANVKVAATEPVGGKQFKSEFGGSFVSKNVAVFQVPIDEEDKPTGLQIGAAIYEMFPVNRIPGCTPLPWSKIAQPFRFGVSNFKIRISGRGALTPRSYPHVVCGGLARIFESEPDYGGPRFSKFNLCNGRKNIRPQLAFSGHIGDFSGLTSGYRRPASLQAGPKRYTYGDQNKASRNRANDNLGVREAYKFLSGDRHAALRTQILTGVVTGIAVGFLIFGGVYFWSWRGWRWLGLSLLLCGVGVWIGGHVWAFGFLG